MKHNKTKLSIRLIEVEGSAETITSIVKSLGDLFPDENGASTVRVTTRTKRVTTEPQTKKDDLIPAYDQNPAAQRSAEEWEIYNQAQKAFLKAQRAQQEQIINTKET
jgi:hypothetical protein